MLTGSELSRPLSRPTALAHKRHLIGNQPLNHRLSAIPYSVRMGQPCGFTGRTTVPHRTFKATTALIWMALAAATATTAPATAQVVFTRATLRADATVPPGNGMSGVGVATDIASANLSQNQSAMSGSNSAKTQGSVSFATPMSGLFSIADSQATANAMSEEIYANSVLTFSYRFNASAEFALSLVADLTKTAKSSVSYRLDGAVPYVLNGSFINGQSIVSSGFLEPGSYTLFLSSQALAIATSTPVDFQKVTGTVGFNLVPNGRVPSAVPEPAAWAMMIVGFGLVGFGLRRRRTGRATTMVAFG